MSWDAVDAELRTAARRLLSEEHGYAFLATTSVDGAPRVTPVAPVVTADAVHLAVATASPALRNLRRDGRFALHGSVHPPSDEEVSVRGRTVERADEEFRAAVVAARVSGAELHAAMTLVELVPEHVAHTIWHHGTPRRTVWRR